MGNDRKKISLPEAILMVMITGAADSIEFVLALFGLNDIGIIDTIVMFIIQVWLVLKGARWGWSLAGNLIEYIPYLDALPIRTITLLITIYLTNNPKLAKIAQVSKPKMPTSKT